MLASLEETGLRSLESILAGQALILTEPTISDLWVLSRSEACELRPSFLCHIVISFQYCRQRPTL